MTFPITFSDKIKCNSLWKIWEIQKCMFIYMFCIFCLLSTFSCMSKRHQPALTMLTSVPSPDLLRSVAHSSWNPLFPTHTSNPLANSVGSFFKIHLIQALFIEIYHFPFPNYSSCLDFPTEPCSCVHLMAWTPCSPFPESSQDVFFFIRENAVLDLAS